MTAICFSATVGRAGAPGVVMVVVVVLSILATPGGSAPSLFGGRRRPAVGLGGFATTLSGRSRATMGRGRYSPVSMSVRGGGVDTEEESEESEELEESSEEREAAKRQRTEEYEKLVRYRTEQRVLYQLRSTYLTELLARRGVPLPTAASVSTPEGSKPPEEVDWDCSMSTQDQPKSCLYSFDAEPNTKVVAPVGTDQWISLSALNRLRRTDPAKVEPMWHSQYAVLRSWFAEESDRSLFQHVGFRGFVVSSVLLDGADGWVLRSLLLAALFTAFVAVLPILEYVLGRLFVSAPFWARWPTWIRFARAGFPLKLLLGQVAWKGLASAFAKLESGVRDRIVDAECEILEECVPLTVGPGVEEEDDIEEEGFGELDTEDGGEGYSDDE